MRSLAPERSFSCGDGESLPQSREWKPNGPALPRQDMALVSRTQSKRPAVALTESDISNSKRTVQPPEHARSQGLPVRKKEKSAPPPLWNATVCGSEQSSGGTRVHSDSEVASLVSETIETVLNREPDEITAGDSPHQCLLLDKKKA